MGIEGIFSISPCKEMKYRTLGLGLGMFFEISNNPSSKAQ
jgi:hypothetical protein